ncbi:MAG: metal ABC transporter substrate-binding protein [Actinobacteria bacterium]|nr:metal ABC transporter substrate-binding protein [Actinomycetota bacterium]
MDTRIWSATRLAGGAAGRVLAAAVLVAGVAALGACGGRNGGAGPDARSEVHVVATTSILGDIVSNVMGDAGRVDVLIGAGVDPHAFEPSAAQVQMLREADLVVANGLQLEERLLAELDAAAREGAAVVHVAEHVDPIPFEDGSPHQADERDPERNPQPDDDADVDVDPHGALDPHFWWDLIRVADAVTVIADHLAQAAPDVAEAATANAASYRSQVLETHQRIVDTLAAVPDERRTLITNHASLGYFAARYGFRLVGTVVPGGTTLAEPSPRQLADLAQVIRTTGVPAVFTESIGSARLVEALRAEVGGEVAVVELYSDALGRPGSGAETYLGMMTTNAQRIADALAP